MVLAVLVCFNSPPPSPHFLLLSVFSLRLFDSCLLSCDDDDDVDDNNNRVMMSDDDDSFYKVFFCACTADHVEVKVMNAAYYDKDGKRWQIFSGLNNDS